MAIKFGDKIQFDVRFKRIRKDIRQKNVPWTDDWRIWKLVGVPESSGIIIGRRTLWNGVLEEESGWRYFVHKEPIAAYLVAINMADNPICIPIEGYNKEERLKEENNNL